MSDSAEVPRAPKASFRSAVAVCADRRYFPMAYVLCLQLAESQPRQYDIYLLTESGAHLAKLPREGVPFHVLTPDFLDRLPTISEMYRHVPPFAYLRLFLPEILPGYDRILYLDCDIRVKESVDPLFTLDMKGHAIAAFGGTFTTLVKSKVQQGDQLRMGRLGFDPAAPYLNSGVLLLDSERWRRERLTDAAIGIAHSYGAALESADQDVLNILFHKAWLLISHRWNFSGNLLETEIETILNPVLVHYQEKPWNFGESTRRERAHFRRIIRRTPVADLLERPSFHDVRHIAAKRAKMGLQYATFFLPSSYQRIKTRSRKRVVRDMARLILKNVESGQFADVEQGISTIDTTALSRLVD
jgi:lipopolysaccharide biosynthesis glycosyltransferase